MNHVVRTVWRVLMVLPIQWRAGLVLFIASAVVAWAYHNPRSALRRLLDAVSAVVEWALAIVLRIDYAANDRRVRAGAAPTAWAIPLGRAAAAVSRLVRLEGYCRPADVEDGAPRRATVGIYAIPAVLGVLPFLVVDLAEVDDPGLAGFGADLVAWWTRLDQRILHW